MLPHSLPIRSRRVMEMEFLILRAYEITYCNFIIRFSYTRPTFRRNDPCENPPRGDCSALILGRDSGISGILYWEARWSTVRIWPEPRDVPIVLRVMLQRYELLMRPNRKPIEPSDFIGFVQGNASLLIISKLYFGRSNARKVIALRNLYSELLNRTQPIQIIRDNPNSILLTAYYFRILSRGNSFLAFLH